MESQQRHDEEMPLLHPASTSNNVNHNTIQPSSSNGINTHNLSSSNNSSSNELNSTMSNIEAGLSKAFKSTADLAKHLPTGCVLIFQILSPVFTNQGECEDINRTMTMWLIVIGSLSVFFLNFTDSFIDSNKNVRYVLATYNGLWVIDGSPPPDPEIAKTYRLKFIDFLHAVMAVMVFSSIALFDNNIESCFYPVMSYDVRQILTVVPLATGIVGSALFVVFPSTRRGIGFPALS